MLAKAYVKGERNVHFLIARPELRNWLHSPGPLDWRALLFWHSHNLTRSPALPEETKKFITGVSAGKKEERDTDLQFL